MNTFALITNGTKEQEPEFRAALQTLGKLARKMGMRILCEQEGLEEVVGNACKFSPVQEFVQNGARMIIVMGGDGTIIHTAQRQVVLETGLPFFAINAGTLGFLAGAEIDELEEMLVALQKEEFDTIHRSTLKYTLNGEETELNALNELVVGRGAFGKAVELTLEVDGSFVANFLSDGLIISTPTGSSAYSLSAGGPLLTPELPAIAITPICPHLLTMRPIVLPDTSRIDITVTRGEYANIDIDGYSSHLVYEGDTVHIYKSPVTICTAELRGRKGIFGAMRSKFLFGMHTRKQRSFK